MNHLDDLLSAWLDGELTAEERAASDRHLAVCELCRTELSVAEGARSAVRGLPQLAPPPAAVRALRRRRRPAAWAAAVAAALAIALWIGPGERGAAFEMNEVEGQHTARVVGDPGISTFRGEQP